MTYARILPLILLAACQLNQASTGKPPVDAGNESTLADSGDPSSEFSTSSGSTSSGSTSSGSIFPGSAFLQVTDLRELSNAGTSGQYIRLHLSTVIHVQPRALNLPYDLNLTVSVLPEGPQTESLRIWGTGGEANVARMSDNTLRVRVGSLQPATCPVEFEISLPCLADGSLPEKLQLTTRVELIDTASGTRIDLMTPLAEQLENIRKRHELERFDTEDMADLWQSVHSGQFGMFTGVLESRAPNFDLRERLWLELACAHDGYSTRWLRLPHSHRASLPENQALIIDDDGVRTRIELESTASLDLDLGAHLDLKDERAVHAQQIQALPSGKLRITFPSLRGLEIKPEDVEGLTLYELGNEGQSDGQTRQIAHFDKLQTSKNGKLN